MKLRTIENLVSKCLANIGLASTADEARKMPSIEKQLNDCAT